MIRNAVPSCLFRDVLFRVKFVLFSSLLALLLQQLLLLQCCNSFHVHQFNLPTTDRINGNLGKESLLYLDNDLIVMNKPHDVQSAPGLIESESLATRVADLFHINRIDQMIVHRLDMATSGIIVYARNVEALANLHKQFRRRKEIYKLYSAVVAGVLPTLEGEISLPIGRDEVRGSPFQAIDPDGKQSVTYWNVRQVGDNCTHLNLRPITGR